MNIEIKAIRKCCKIVEIYNTTETIRSFNCTLKDLSEVKHFIGIIIQDIDCFGSNDESNNVYLHIYIDKINDNDYEVLADYIGDFIEAFPEIDYVELENDVGVIKINNNIKEEE